MSKQDKNKRLFNLLDGDDNKIDKILSGYEKQIIAEYKKALQAFKLELAHVYERFGEKPAYQDVRIKNIIDSIRNDVKSLSTEAQNTIEECIKDIFGTSYELTCTAINSVLDTEIVFGRLTTEQMQASILNPADKIKWVTRNKKHINKLVNDVKAEVTQGLIQGKPYNEIARGITERTGVAAGKAVRIARTETHRVTSAARQISFDKTFDAADELGIKVQKVWIAIKDGRSKDRHHEKMDGKQPDDNGYYTLPSGIKTLGPGLSGDPNEDINCRCTEGIEIMNL